MTEFIDTQKALERRFSANYAGGLRVRYQDNTRFRDQGLQHLVFMVVPGPYNRKTIGNVSRRRFDEMGFIQVTIMTPETQVDSVRLTQVEHIIAVFENKQISFGQSGVITFVSDGRPIRRIPAGVIDGWDQYVVEIPYRRITHRS